MAAEQTGGLPELFAHGPSGWPARLRTAIWHFVLLCAGIVALMLIPLRVHEGDGWLFVAVVAVVVVAWVLVWIALRNRAERRLGGRIPNLAAWVALRTLRRAGLSLLGLAFFALWTMVYLALWLIHPHEAFTGLDPAPRVSDFFYYAVSTALTSPPEGIGAGSRGVRAATLIEMLMGFSLIAAYLASFARWDAPSAPDP